jgi:hypothetical protein
MWKKLSYIIAGLAAVVAGGISLLNFFVLPTCESDRSTDTVRSIFEGQNVPLTVLDNIQTVSSTSARVDCSAHIETADETGEIKYSVTWDGWGAQVRIEEVDAQPTNPPEPEAPAAPEPAPAPEPAAPAPQAPMAPEPPAMPAPEAPAAPAPMAPAPEAPAPAPQAPAAPGTPPG